MLDGGSNDCCCLDLFLRWFKNWTQLSNTFVSLHKDPQPLCIPCHSSFSIEHILTEYIEFQPIRVNYYSTSDISQLFHKVHPSSILQYMNDICLCKNL